MSSDMSSEMTDEMGLPPIHRGMPEHEGEGIVREEGAKLDFSRSMTCLLYTSRCV